MALLAVMEQMHAPAEEVLASLDMAFDPRRTPDAFVPFLATWVDLASLLRDLPPSSPIDALSTGTGRLRELVAAAAYLSQWRGTRRGLLRFLETATGVTGFDVNETVVEDGRVAPYHLQITAPASVKPYRSLLERIIEMEKPAYVTYKLLFAE